MFKEDFLSAANASSAKLKLLRDNIVGYFALSVLAGMFVGFGVLLAFSAGGMLAGAPAAKLIMGACFGVALSLVVFSGAELFTGNNLVMTAGMLKGKVTLSDSILLWAVCWLGNTAGGVLLAALYYLTGLGRSPIGEFMADAALAKTSAAPIELITRGMLCNMLVCIAVWCGFRMKSESGKLIMIFWCLLAFFTTGFEHSVANMTLLTYTLFNPCGRMLTPGGWFYNLGLVTLGNMLGGILLVALPYYLAQRDPD